MNSQAPQRVTNVVFRTRNDNEWTDLRSEQLFSGRTVVLFSLPGAFTPTCSSSHVPRFNQLAPALKAQGADEIICISVNDAFVMNGWKIDQRADDIKHIPDGTGEFTKGMGMLVDQNDLGFGKHSRLYSMLVRDGLVDKMFDKPDITDDPFEV